MTRQQIETDYTVTNGVIRSPGKFEGEAVYVPYFWDALIRKGRKGWEPRHRGRTR